MTASLLHAGPTVRRALSEADWAPATSTSPTTARGEPSQDNLVFGSSYTPEPTDERSVVVAVPRSSWERMESAIEKINQLACLELNWDSYGAIPIQPSAGLHAIRLIAAILQNDVPLPAIVPTSKGGVQLEWHKGNVTLEMEVLPDRTVEVYAVNQSGSTWEGKLANNQWRLEAFLSQLMA